MVDYSPVTSGIYEVKICLVTLNASKSGKKFLDFNLEIRPDIRQQSAGLHIHAPLVNSYDLRQIAVACGLQQQDYCTLQDVINDFKDRLVRIHLVRRAKICDGETYHNCADIISWMPTMYPEEKEYI